MYLPFIWHADKVYLQRYQNMCYDVIYHCEIEQIFPPVAYIILRGKPAATEAKINNRCGKEKFTIFGLQPANIWGWNQRWHWFMELSFLIVTWFLQFFSVIEFKKTGICSVSRIFMRKRLKEKLMPVNIRLFWVLKNQFIQCINMGHISWNPCRIENSSIITEDWKS